LSQWSRLTRIIQRLREVFTVPSGGEYSPRRPLHLVRAEVVEIERHERLALGSVEQLSAGSYILDAPTVRRGGG
jgi:hypothetical protein